MSVKNMSIKMRISLWFTLMVMILSVLVLVFVLVVNSASITPEPAERLVKLVMRNARRVEFDNGKFDWDDLKFYKRGISCTFYNGDGELLKGSVIDGLDADLPLESDILRSFESDGVSYYLYDSYVDMDVAGFWIRGIVNAENRSGLMHTIIILTCTLLPALLIITLGVGYLIVRGSFRPMERIISAADSISDGDDLSARIGLNEGPGELRQLSTVFDRMLARLEQSFNTERQFASDASHELRTPITVILAQCERSRRKDKSPEDFLSSIDVIEEQTRGMSQLVQQLLGLTRLQHGTDRYIMKEADFSRFLVACCDDFVPEDERGIKLTLDIEEGIMAVFNGSLMSRAIQNLLQNAYKYGRENGNISVSLKKDGQKAVLKVQDDGTGIAPENIDLIWQRFWQAEPSRSTGGSSGLGLSMVKEIAKLHGGTAEVESESGRGSTFILTI